MNTEPIGHNQERIPDEVAHSVSELRRVSHDPYRDAVDGPYYKARLARLLAEADKHRV
jgi:hypothetical protein